MWQKQTNTLIKTNESTLSIRFDCPSCGNQNKFDDINLPEFSDNYEKPTDSDVTEDEFRTCSNNNCQAELKISVTNGAGGYLIQVENVADNDIEIDI